MAELTVAALRSLDEIRAVESEWRDLADVCGGEPFLLPAVALAWLEHLGRGRPLIITVRDAAQRLVALAPFVERRIGALEVVRWVGHGLGAVGELLVAPEADEAAALVWKTLVGSPRRVLQLTECRSDGVGLDTLRSSGWGLDSLARDTCPVIDLRGHESVESFLGQQGKRKLRQNLARQDRFATQSPGRLTVEIHMDSAAVTAVLDDLTLVHDRAEAANARLHFLAGSYRAFTVAALSRCAAEGRLAVVVVRLDGEAIGFHVVITAGSMAYAWLARSDPAASDWAPGHVMLRAAVGWAIEQGFEWLDLQLGGDAYKLRWSTCSYETEALLAARPIALRTVSAHMAATEWAFALRRRISDRGGGDR